MQFARVASRTASLALSLCPLAAHTLRTDVAHGYNITLRFFEQSQKDTCDYHNSSRAPTFTTDSLPVAQNCFNIEDLFGGNATQGFVNQTLNYGRVGQAGIYWQLENVDLYNPQTNYSSVQYHLFADLAEPSDSRFQPGHYADRVVNVYPAKGCREAPADPKIPAAATLPWYGFSCWSDDKGICATTPYSIQSFYILPGFDEEAQDARGKCWAGAKWGAASSAYSSSHAMVSATFSGLLAIYLAW